MLVRLDQELEPLRAAVDREGTLLRVSGESQRDDPGLADRVVGIVAGIGYFAEPLEGEAPGVTRWFAREDIRVLSEAEADILSERWAIDLAREGVIADAETIREPLRDALVQSFLDAASSGYVGRIEMDMSSCEKSSTRLNFRQ